jgi:hypothetical protein
MAPLKHECFYLQQVVNLNRPEVVNLNRSNWSASIGLGWSTSSVFAINACLMATFLAIANNSKVEFSSFQSDATGKVEKIDGKYAVTEITITPKLVIPAHGDEERIRHIFQMSEKACAISNSIKSKINLMPEIAFR